MLPREHRLHGDQQFQKLARQGRSYFGPVISVKVVPNGLAISRFAFVISTKTAKRAVVRNSVKRRMREIIRKELPHLQKGFDALLIARPRSTTLDYWGLEEHLIDMLKKARLYI